MSTSKSILVIVLLIAHCSYTYAFTFARQTQSHPLESEGPRPIYSYESIHALGTSSKFRMAASPVGEILFRLATDEVVSVCTALVISPVYVLTARHCLEHKDTQTGTWEPYNPKAVILLLDYLDPTMPATPVSLKKVPVEKGAEEKLDYMILQSEDMMSIENRHIPAFGPDPGPKDDLYIIHHPFGRTLTLSRYYCQATEKPEEGENLNHICDTQDGSSGAPVFDTDLRLVGIQVGGGKTEAPDSYNQALLVSAIIAHSRLVKDSLGRYGARSAAPSIPASARVKAVTPAALQTPAKYDVAGVLSITHDPQGWVLFEGGSKKETRRLRSQQADNSSDLLLWDPVRDDLYWLPKSGGKLKRKRGGEPAWTEIGVATMK